MKRHLKWMASFLSWQLATTCIITVIYLISFKAGTGISLSVLFSMLSAIVYTFFLSAYFGDDFIPTTELYSESTNKDKVGVSFIIATGSFFAARAAAFPVMGVLAIFCIVFVITMIVTMEAVIVIVAILVVLSVGSGIPHYAIIALLGANLALGFIRRVNNLNLMFRWVIISSSVQAAVLYVVIYHASQIISIMHI